MIFIFPKLLANIRQSANFPRYKKALSLLAQGRHANGQNLEKLQGKYSQLYSVRCSMVCRLILKKMPDGGWLLLDVLDNHNYNSLKNERWKAWIEEQQTKEIDLFDEDFQANESTVESKRIAVDDEQHKEVEFVEIAEPIFYNQQFNILDETQQKAINVSFPVVGHGPPGSGKTFFTFPAFKKNYLGSCEPIKEGERYSLVYSSLLKDLVEWMKDMWSQQVKIWQEEEFVNIDLSKFDIHFKTLEELYKDFFNLNKEFVGQDYFSEWFLNENNRQRINSIRVGEQKDETQYGLLLQRNCYSEFRVMSGYDCYEDYNRAISGRYSLFPERQRENVWKLYEAYISYLEKADKIDAAFFKLPLNKLGKKRIDFGVFDETQDFSRAQILSCKQLIRNNNICYLVGDHQATFGAASVIPYINSIFYDERIRNPGKNLKELEMFVLNSSYRCFAEAVSFVNFVLQFKYYAMGGQKAKDKNEFFYMKPLNQTDDGRILWVNDDELKSIEDNWKEDAGFAVITSKEFAREAEKKFNEYNVFTPEQIKGLQYPRILLYRLFEGEEGKKAAEAVKSYKLQQEKSDIIISTNPDGSLDHNQFFNHIFISALVLSSSLLFTSLAAKKIFHQQHELWLVS